MTTHDEHRALLIGLVPPKHQQLYLTSPAFKTALETLARMLPLWVDGLAVECASHQDKLCENLIRDANGLPLIRVDNLDFVKSAEDQKREHE